MTTEIIKETKRIVTIGIMEGPLGKSIVVTNPSKEGGGGERLAGQIDGFGANPICSWTVDADHLKQSIDHHTEQIEEFSYIDR